ncbi:MAG: putative quinol monooxygenase [Planctomycetota bacterium]
MLVYVVQVHVKAERRAEFIAATLENARHTVEEPGNLRFDVLEQDGDPSRFVLYEVYRDAAAVDAHKATPHYATWRDTVADWMAEPRKGVKYSAHFPTEAS